MKENDFNCFAALDFQCLSPGICGGGGGGWEGSSKEGMSRYGTN